MPTYDDWYNALLKDNIDQVHPWLDQDPGRAVLAFSSEMTLLMIAAQKGAVRCVKALLPFSDATMTDENGWSALTCAINRKHQGCIDLLMPVCDPSTVDSNGRSLLHLAAEKGLGSTVSALLERLPADHAKIVDHEGKTALHEAAAYGDLASLDALIPVSDPNEPDEEGWTPLMFAVIQRRDEAARRLAPITNVAWTNLDGQSATSLAERQGGFDMVKLLDAERRRQEERALRQAIETTAGPHLDARVRPRL